MKTDAKNKRREFYESIGTMTSPTLRFPIGNSDTAQHIDCVTYWRVSVRDSVESISWHFTQCLIL